MRRPPWSWQLPRRRLVSAILFLALAAAASLLYPGAACLAADDLTVLRPDEAPRTMLYRALQHQAEERLAARRQEVAALKTPEAIRQRQEQIRAKFRAALGDLPPKTPLNAGGVGSDRRDGYTVERVIYESRPGHHVTANLYLPAGKAPFPGVLVPCGHSANGKAAETYQRISILLAKNGMAALCYDPISQGERLQALDDQGKPLTAGGTTEHTMAGIGALLVGRSAATYAIRDGIRSIDYLASRPEVDPNRLGCTGNSGGGTLTAYLMALDGRIAAAVPSCYITSLERLFATIGPQDAEQNITGQVAFGMDHADYVILRAPKPTMLSVGTQDFFDIQGSWDTFREVKLIYGRLGYGERIDLFESDEKHGFTLPRRQAAMRWLRRWLLKIDDAPEETDFPIATDLRLQCTKSGQVLTDFHGKSVFDLNAEREAELAKQRAEYQASHSKEERLAKVRELIGLSEPVKPAKLTERGVVKGDGYRIEKLVFETEPGILVPGLLWQPESADNESPLAIQVGLETPTADELRRMSRLEGYSTSRLLFIHLRGTGESAPNTKSPFGADWKEAFLSLHLARPLLGQRVGDLLAVIAAMAGDAGVVRHGVELGAFSAAAPIALHAAALEPRIKSLNLTGMLISWSDVAHSAVTHEPLSNVVPGALANYDLPDLAALVAPRGLSLHGLIDPVGLPVNPGRVEKTYAAAGHPASMFIDARPSIPARLPLLRTLDLSIGETQTIALSSGKPATAKLLNVDERRDPIRAAVREAKVTLEINGQQVTLTSGNYNLPVTVAGVQVDCPITGGYRSNSNGDAWGLEKDARIRLWPAGSPWIEPQRFVYPARQRWFASSTQMANEPTYVDGCENPSVKKIYYHYGLDIGGAEGLVNVVAATDGLVVSAGTKLLDGFNETPAKPRYDVVYLLDDQGWYYRYSHLQSIDPAITPGATVRMGQRIGVLGKEGSSGGWSHLHFDITSRQPSGKWGIQEGYAFLWQAIQREQKPEVIAVARPHHLTWAGETVVLDGSKSWSKSGPIASFVWTFSDQTTAEGPKVERTYNLPGAYSEVLKMTDAHGHVGYDFAIVQVLDRAHPDQIPPATHAAYFPTSGIKPGDSVTFKVRTFGTTDGHETWDFGDGSPSVEVKSDGNVDQHAKDGYAVTSHRFDKPGQYLVRVERTDRRGFTGTARLVVTVEP